MARWGFNGFRGFVRFGSVHLPRFKKGSGETEFRSAFSHVSRMPETATINYLWIFGDTSGILKKTESQNDKFLRDKRFTRYFTIHLCSA